MVHKLEVPFDGDVLHRKISKKPAQLSTKHTQPIHQIYMGETSHSRAPICTRGLACKSTPNAADSLPVHMKRNTSPILRLTLPLLFSRSIWAASISAFLICSSVNFDVSSLVV
jgi:hypothetical protein